jgi:hypothetical protein
MAHEGATLGTNPALPPLTPERLEAVSSGMPYAVTYNIAEGAVSVGADSAREALDKARAFEAKGHSPTIVKDGLPYSLPEFERIVGSVQFGD